MPWLKVPKTVTAITINASPLVPTPTGEIQVSELEARMLAPRDHQQLWLQSTNSDGSVNLKLPAMIDSMTIGGVPYGKDGNGVFLNIPALVANDFLLGESERTFQYAHA